MKDMKKKHIAFKLMSLAGTIFIIATITTIVLLIQLKIYQRFPSLGEQSANKDPFPDFGLSRIAKIISLLAICIPSVLFSISYMAQIVGTVVYGVNKERKMPTLIYSVIGCVIPVLGLFATVIESRQKVNASSNAVKIDEDNIDDMI